MQKTGSEIVAIEDINWRDDSKGLPGQQLGLQLLLRVVADVGIVGFPNAGEEQPVVWPAGSWEHACSCCSERFNKFHASAAMQSPLILY